MFVSLMGGWAIPSEGGYREALDHGSRCGLIQLMAL